MTLLDTLVDQAITSELFTAPRIEADLAAFLAERTDAVKSLARGVADGEFDQVYFVGSGGSYANMASGQLLVDHYGGVASAAYPSYELTWRDPVALGPKPRVPRLILRRHRGHARGHAPREREGRHDGRDRQAPRDPSPMAIEAGVVIDYDVHGALRHAARGGRRSSPPSSAILTGGPRADDARALLESLAALPPVLGEVYRRAQAPALEQARAFLPAQLLYCVGAGPLAGLAYKFALTVFMENIRVHGSFIESSELRHGPIEAFERQRPDMVFVVGTDESRAMTLRSLDLVRDAGAHTLVIDAADYPATHPQLTPFLLLVPLQWFVVYSALLRGITDLDDRVFMGRRLLATGPDATWP